MSDSPVITPPVPARGGQPSRRVPGKFYPGSDVNRLHGVLVFAGRLRVLPGFAVALLWSALLALAAYLAWLVGGLAPGIAVVLALAAAGAFDAAVLDRLPRARLSFGPFAPQFLLLAGARTLVAVALIACARLGLPATWAAGLAAGAQLAGCALVWRAFVVEPGRVQVTRRRVDTPKLQGRLRVLVVGDLHVERRSVREEQLQRLIDECDPDLLLFTGDFLNLSCVHDPRAQAEVRDALRGWHARYGVYAVTGSPLVDPPEVAARILEGLPIVWLRNQVAVAGPAGARIRVVGLTCTHIPEDDILTLQATLAGAPGDGLFTILAYHTPDLAPQAASAGIDLQVSGHTHGGQVRLPGLGALVTSSLHRKRFEMGAYRVGEMLLYVARGIGLEGQGAPRARFLCEPEVVLWDIAGDGEQAAGSGQ